MLMFNDFLTIISIKLEKCLIKTQLGVIQQLRGPNFTQIMTIYHHWFWTIFDVLHTTYPLFSWPSMDFLPLLVHVAIEWPLIWNKECSFRNDAHYVIYELGTGRDPHQLLLNTSHFLPLSLEKLLSYMLEPALLIQLPRKSEILAPNFLRVDALRCFEIGSRAKKMYIHTYPFHVLCTFVAISTYLHTCHLTACTMRPNRVWNCILIKTLMISRDIFLLSTFNTLRK